MMMLTASTAWATDYTVTYTAKFAHWGNGLYNIILQRSGNSSLKATIADKSSAWQGNTGVCVNDEYDVTFKPSKNLSVATTHGTSTATGFTMSSGTTFTASVANNSSYYIKQVKLLNNAATTGTSAATAPNSRSATVTASGGIQFNYIEVTITDDYYGTITPQNSLTVNTDASLTYGNTKYYVSGTTITMNAPTNHIIDAASGVSGANIAANKRSYTFTMPKQNVTPGATLTEVYTMSTPSGLTITTNPYFTDNTTKYYKTGATYTLTVDDANKVIKTFSASGASGSSVANDRRTATVTIGTSNVTVSATLLTITGTSNGVTWSMSDSDSNGTYDRLTLSGSGTLSTSPWATDFAASISRVDVSSADITISGNPFSALADGAVIVVSTFDYAVTYASAGFAAKLRVALGNYLFGVTTEGGTAAYKIATADDLRNLSAAVNTVANISSGKTFRQTADINLASGGNFTPIGELGADRCFFGTYDGGGHTISGLTVSIDYGIIGLFAKIYGATLRGITLISPTITATRVGDYDVYLGAVVGSIDGSGSRCVVENCYVVNPTLSSSSTSSYNYVGAIFGRIFRNKATVTNCYFYDAAAATHNYAAYGTKEQGTVTNVSAAHLVTLASNVTATPAIGTDGANGFSYGGKNYWREGAELTLATTLSIPTHYHAIYKTDGNTLKGSTYTVNGTDGDVTLTADYAINTYTVHFNANGGDGQMSDQVFTYNEAQKLTAKAFTRTGYTFAGWATSENGNVVYSDQQSVSNLTTENNATVNLYAKWTCNTYTVTLHNQDATTAGTASVTATYGAAMPAITVPERTGYTFGGYFTETNGGGTQYYKADGTSAHNWNITQATTLYAKWSQATYTITYNLNGGTLETSKNSYTFLSDDITLDTPTRKGYTFLGWYDNSGLTGPEVKTIGTGSAGDKQLWAKWGIPYIDADGNTQYCNGATVLTSSTDISSLKGGWYVVPEDVSYDKELYCANADIHLILCDGAEMTIENGSYAIYILHGSLTIYAQSTGSSMGQLVATSTNDSGIYDYGSIFICGGNITATGGNSSGNSGILSQNNVTIYSGQVSATGKFGIQACGTTTLGLRNADDYIQASSYSGIVNIADGQTLTDGTTFYRGGASIPGGKTLRPFEPLELSDNGNNAEAIREAAAASTGGRLYNVTLSGRTLYRDGDWNTLCLPFALSAEQIAASPLAGAIIMELDGTRSDLTDGTLTLNFNAVKEIEAGRPYIVKWPLARIINTTSDWQDFAADVAGGNTYEGKKVMLAADIEVSEMVGTSKHTFKGIFEGQGHTLTLNSLSASGEEACAPFRYVEGATIANLHTTGTVIADNNAASKFRSGLVGQSDGNTTIQNCWCSVTISSGIEGDGSHGGFIGLSNSGNATISNCRFDGSLSGSNTTCWGGFVGCSSSTTTISNSAFLPEGISINQTGSATFGRNQVITRNCYYSVILSHATNDATSISVTSTGNLAKNLGNGWQVKDGKAVPVTAAADLVNPVFSPVTVSDATNDVTFYGGWFKGTYENVSFTQEDKDILFMGKNNTLYYPKSGARIGAFRAYFKFSDPELKVKSFVLNFGEDDAADGIDNLTPSPSPKGEGSIYSLDGRRIVNGRSAQGDASYLKKSVNRQLPKGIYIRNGKKIAIK